MTEQVNSGSGIFSTVELDTVLELLEKTVLLIGQCNKTITYERRKDVLLGITGASSLQYLKKSQHSYKNTIRRSLEKTSETI